MAVSLGIRRGLRRASLLVASAAALTVTACGGDGAGADGTNRDAAVYGAIIELAASDLATADNPPTVFVAPLPDGTSFPLDLQVAVIDQVGDQATVRFVDDLEQAVDRDVEDEPVLDDGVLLRLGPVPATPTPLVVDGERFRTAADGIVVRYQVRRDDDTWIATATPAGPVPSTVAG